MAHNINLIICFYNFHISKCDLAKKLKFFVNTHHSTPSLSTNFRSTAGKIHPMMLLPWKQTGKQQQLHDAATVA